MHVVYLRKARVPTPNDDALTRNHRSNYVFESRIEHAICAEDMLVLMQKQITAA